MSSLEAARKFTETGKKEAEAGLRIIKQLQQSIPAKPFNKEVTETLGGFVQVPPQKPIRDGLIASAIAAMKGSRPIAAGLVFIQLRQSFGLDRDWREYIEEVPLELEEVERLIGQVAFRNAMAGCAKCGTQVRCPCQCGAPYRPEKPWDEEPDPEPETVAAKPSIPRKLGLAMVALQANPSKSNALIAKEIKVDKETVRQARKKFAENSPPPPELPALVTLKSPVSVPGRRYQALSPEGEGECDYSPEHEGAFPDMTAAERRRDAAVFQATEAFRMARDYALLEPGGPQGEKIAPTRLKEVRATIRAWERVAEALAKKRRLK